MTPAAYVAGLDDMGSGVVPGPPRGVCRVGPGGFRPQASLRTGLLGHTSGSLRFGLTGRTSVRPEASPSDLRRLHWR
jgi:hypothetical protein